MTERTIDRLLMLRSEPGLLAPASWHAKIHTNCSGDRYIASTSNRQAMVLEP